MDDFKETLISFDYGEKFQRIPAPEVDYKGDSIECDTKCYLNLHL